MEKIDWHLLTAAPSEEGEKRKLKVGGKTLCIVHLEGKIRAVGNRCPHAGADLSQGWCEESKIVCPFHRHRFDLLTGKGDAGQANFIPVYPVKQVDGKWYVGIKKSWWKGW